MVSRLCVRFLVRMRQVRRGQTYCSETLFQLRCGSIEQSPEYNARGIECARQRPCASAASTRSQSPRAALCPSLSVVGKQALLAHDGCTRMLRHHALAMADTDVGGRCRGALAAMGERRAARALPPPVGAAAAAGHLMISCASPCARALTMPRRLRAAARALGGWRCLGVWWCVCVWCGGAGDQRRRPRTAVRADA